VPAIIAPVLRAPAPEFARAGLAPHADVSTAPRAVSPGRPAVRRRVGVGTQAHIPGGSRYAAKQQ
jgi:hypothetical protein